MKKIKRGTLIVIACILLLTVAVAVFAIVGAGDIGIKRELEMKAQFAIKYNDIERLVTMQDIINLRPAEFDAVLNTSNTGPTDVKFTGVELSKICENKGFDISCAQVLEVRALDGYSSALTVDEALEEDNVYICIYMNGEALKPKGEGGFGPYMMVIRSSAYSQRWCKYVQEVVIR
ncbi:MAG: molybdopterin-dependent oxidoreductase [Christensenellales bacterium]